MNIVLSISDKKCFFCLAFNSKVININVKVCHGHIYFVYY